MKVAVFIENGATQLVLTPEGEWEKTLCDKIATNGESRVSIYRGSFYDCRGGWTRYRTSYGYTNDARDDDSLILRVEANTIPAEPA